MDLVTGGLGFIGNELVRQLLADGRDVTIVDNRNRVAPRIEDIADVPVVDCDIADHDALLDAVRAVAPERVFHLAALHYIPECNANPERTLRVNVEGTLSVLRAAAAAGAKHVVFASSGAVYADSPDPLTEGSPLQPVDIYGQSKLYAEQLCEWFGNLEELPVTACRFFNNYGPRETNAHIIPEIISQLRAGDTLNLGTISTVRDYVHTADTAKGMRLLAEQPPRYYRAVNLSGGQSATVQQLIDMMAKLLGREVKVLQDPSRVRKVDKRVQVADISLLSRLTGWTPATSLLDGLEQLLEFEDLLA